MIESSLNNRILSQLVWNLYRGYSSLSLRLDFSSISMPLGIEITETKARKSLLILQLGITLTINQDNLKMTLLGISIN